MEHGSKYIAFYVQKHITPHAVCHNFSLVSRQAAREARICETSLLWKHAHPFRSTSERSGAHMYHLFIDEIVEN